MVQYIFHANMLCIGLYVSVHVVSVYVVFKSFIDGAIYFSWEHALYRFICICSCFICLCGMCSIVDGWIYLPSGNMPFCICVFIRIRMYVVFNQLLMTCVSVFVVCVQSSTVEYICHGNMPFLYMCIYPYTYVCVLCSIIDGLKVISSFSDCTYLIFPLCWLSCIDGLSM